jgi:hypothetical protein
MKDLQMLKENLVYIEGLVQGMQSKIDDMVKQESPQESKESEFKVGQWVCLHGSSYPYRIEKIDNNGNLFVNNLCGTSHLITSGGFHLATPQEIENHLKKIAEEKGFKNNTLIRGLTAQSEPFYSCYVMETPLSYNEPEDSLCSQSGDRVYCRGKWAEIVPVKKKLPKNKEELKQFYYAWYGDGTMDFQAFVDQCED